MDRLFGKSKKEAPKAPVQEEKYDINAHNVKLDSKTNEMDAKLRKIEDEIKIYYDKLKKTNISSEKEYIKGRLRNLLMQRKMVEQQMGRYFNQKMMVDKVQFNAEAIQDTINMGKFLDQTNKVQQQQLQNFDMDKIQDAMEDMEERAWENDRIAEVINQDIMNVADPDIDDQLANLENELDVQKLMEQDDKKNQNFKYNPLADL